MRKATLGMVGDSAKTKARKAEAQRAKQEAELLEQQTKAAKDARKDAKREAKAERNAEARAEFNAMRERRRADKAAKASEGTGSAPEAPVTDLVSSLERLAALRDSGAISDADYETAKAQLLAQPTD